MQARRKLLGVLAGLASATVLAACGGDEGVIPPDAASEIEEQLAAIQDQVDRGDCVAARSTAEDLAENLNRLPEDLTGRSQVVAAGSNLVQLTADSEACRPPQEGATGPDGATTETTAEEPVIDPETTDEVLPPEDESSTSDSPPTDEGDTGDTSQGDENGQGPDGTGPPGQSDGLSGSGNNNSGGNGGGLGLRK